ncbi:hypothetical protein GCM10025883_43830 [Mobilicoccus caccae]|uniref:Uncharacterized protein n=1 Tax=Mobilicoccus caccae TaxID=1859295 RepID=A0ABQ6IWK0_9MICO|nr:hypothetical protein GCM10025883_43830 [Mobilicoccus caccae]
MLLARDLAPPPPDLGFRRRRHEDVRGLLHHRHRGADRVAGPTRGGHGPCGAVAPHHAGVQLGPARRGERGPAAGVEEGAVLEFDDGGTDRVLRATTGVEHDPPRRQGAGQALLAFDLLIGSQRPPTRPGATVDGQGVGTPGGDGDLLDLRAWP